MSSSFSTFFNSRNDLSSPRYSSLMRLTPILKMEVMQNLDLARNSPLVGSSQRQEIALTISPYRTLISKDKQEEQLIDSANQMLSKYKRIKEWTNRGLLSSNLVDFANNLSDENALVLFSDNADHLESVVEGMSHEDKQHFLSLAAIIGAVGITNKMINKPPMGLGISPHSNTATLAFLSPNSSIPASLVGRGDAPVLSMALLFASHALNTDSLKLLQQKYPDDVEQMIENSDVSVLPAALISNHSLSHGEVDKYIKAILAINKNPSLIDAQMALFHDNEEIVQQYLEKAPQEEKNKFLEYAKTQKDVSPSSSKNLLETDTSITYRF